MASNRAPGKAKRGAGRKKRGSTSTTSQGLVLRVIKNDPECAWMAGFVQQLGEKFFGGERFGDLNDRQRRGWFRFNVSMARIGKSIARREGDYTSLLSFLERIGEDESDADFAQVQAEVEALGKKEDPAGARERREDALLDAYLDDRETWRKSHRTKVGLTVFWVLFTALMIVVAAASEKAGFVGGSGISAGVAVWLINVLFEDEASL
jgi:hypothetical protein